jgi:signal peptidase I
MWAAVGVLTQWAWSEPRRIIALWTALAATVLVNLAIAWHAWHLARTSTDHLRPRRAGLAIMLISTYAVVTVIGFVETRWIKRNVIQAYRIASTSMEPSLLAGDWVFVSHRRVPLRRDQLVVFTKTGDTLIKRIAGLPGDTLQMRDGTLLRDGIMVNDSATITTGPDASAEEFAWQAAHLTSTVDSRSYHPTNDNWGPLVVPDHRLFVLGDNRHYSKDSRYYGFISTDSVTGHPTQVYYSRDPERRVSRWNRFGHRLDQ